MEWLEKNERSVAYLEKKTGIQYHQLYFMINSDGLPREDTMKKLDEINDFIPGMKNKILKYQKAKMRKKNKKRLT